MNFVQHRVNRVAALRRLDLRWGAEIDIRSRRGRLILAHEPHTAGDALERFLDQYASQRRTQLLILNPKEDGLEDDVLTLLRQRRIETFFFLDLTIPTTVRLMRKKEPRIALRVSEYESVQTALSFRGQARWIWLDCFSGKPAPRDRIH